MGKSKKRSFCKNIDNIGTVLKRSDILDNIISDIRFNNISEETKKYVGLFGITYEELSEAGITFEELSAVKHLFY